MLTITALATSLLLSTSAEAKPKGCDGHWYSYTLQGGTEEVCCHDLTTQECKDDCKKVVDGLGSIAHGCDYHSELRVGGDEPVDAFETWPDEPVTLDISCEGPCELIGFEGEVYTDSPYLDLGMSLLLEPGEHQIGLTSTGLLELYAL